MAAVIKPRGEKLYAILADLAVFQLLVTKHAYFFTANFTVFLFKSIKQTHNLFLL